MLTRRGCLGYVYVPQGTHYPEQPLLLVQDVLFLSYLGDVSDLVELWPLSCTKPKLPDGQLTWTTHGEYCTSSHC